MTNSKIERQCVSDPDITIKRITMGNLCEVTNAVDPFLSEFEKLVEKQGKLTDQDLFRLAGYHSDDMMNLAVILTDKKKNYYKDMDPDQFLKIMGELISFSGDFFLRKWITPLLKVGSKLRLLSLTLYTQSSNQGTHTKQ